MEQNTIYTKIPLIVTSGFAIFPYTTMQMDVGREKSVQAVEEAMANNKKIIIAIQKNMDVDEIKNIDELHEIGIICNIKQILRLQGSVVRVLIEGENRCIISKLYQDENYLEADAQEVRNKDEVSFEQTAYIRTSIEILEEYIELRTRNVQDTVNMLKEIKSAGRFCDIASTYLPFSFSQRLDILFELDETKRIKLLYDMLVDESKIAKIEQKIHRQIRREMTKNERIHYLRNQLDAINKELGQFGEGNSSKVEKYREELKKLNISDTIKEKIEKEISKLERENKYSSEAEVSRNYIETFFSLPWDKQTDEKIDLKYCEEILDSEHFGMEKVKDRIVEYLAVKKISKNLKSPIICFVGPPGVGKTSIAKSIAKSVNRKFARISLGGVRDEAEIRGHRRTYIGAIPGRIINTLIEVKSNNPVILFDEIDKMSQDYKGSVESAMLEVLDPEQNKTFTDHYLEYEFDLSKVMFITTANTLDSIPRPLIDRMEIIRLSGYTEQEKLEIAKRYLLPKQIKEHNFKQDFIKISDDVMQKIITNFTRESGVRGLEQKIATICRKIAKKKVLSPRMRPVTIKDEDLSEFLGKEVFKFEVANKQPQVGIVRGLAWTQIGGDTLSVEVNVMNGNGKIELTGKLGDVMKESAKTGLSYVRSISEKYKIDPDFYKNKDIHIHIPEGATPKDGPSAGVTMATAIVSALANIKVREDIAMTGEITLRGRVLPVGGIKEKFLAAHRAGIYNIILPSENEKDIEDLPKEIREQMTFTLAEDMETVLDMALVKEEAVKDTKKEVATAKDSKAGIENKKVTVGKTTAKKQIKEVKSKKSVSKKATDKKPASKKSSTKK